MAGTSSRVAPCEALRAGRRLDLDAVRARELVRAALGQQLAAVDDRDAVADLLDLAEQVGVQQHGDAAAAQLDEQVADDPPPDRVERARGLVEQQQRAGRRRAPARSRGAAACPSTSSRRGGAPSSPRPTSPAARRARPRRRSSRTGAGAGAAARRRSPSRGSGRARPGSRARRARRRRPGRGAAHLARCPPTGGTRPAAILTSVDLPAPLGPSRPTSSASPTVRSTPRSACGGAVALGQAADLERGRHERRRTIACASVATVRIRRGTAADAALVLALFDEAVVWLVARGQPGQWGTTPWSRAPERGRAREDVGARSGLRIAQDADATPLGRARPGRAPAARRADRRARALRRGAA